jgi:hypothetical protein
MALVQVAVDVYCDSGVDPSAYRVYVDNDLLTERSWIWPSYETFIREHIVVDVDPGTHTVRLERCQGVSNFTVRAFSVDGQSLNPDNLSFTVGS